MKIKFLTDIDRTFEAGKVYDLDPGVADAYVVHRRCAEYVPDELKGIEEVSVMTKEDVEELADFAAKAIQRPAKDKMIHAAPAIK